MDRDVAVSVSERGKIRLDLIALFWRVPSVQVGKAKEPREALQRANYSVSCADILNEVGKAGFMIIRVGEGVITDQVSRAVPLRQALRRGWRPEALAVLLIVMVPGGRGATIYGVCNLLGAGTTALLTIVYVLRIVRWSEVRRIRAMTLL